MKLRQRLKTNSFFYIYSSSFVYTAHHVLVFWVFRCYSRFNSAKRNNIYLFICYKSVFKLEWMKLYWGCSSNSSENHKNGTHSGFLIALQLTNCNWITWNNKSSDVRRWSIDINNSFAKKNISKSYDCQFSLQATNVC
jgi:hypothetical protein